MRVIQDSITPLKWAMARQLLETSQVPITATTIPLSIMDLTQLLSEMT